MKNDFINDVIKKNFSKMFRYPLYSFFLFLTGLPVMLFTLFYHIGVNKKASAEKEKDYIRKKLIAEGDYGRLKDEVLEQLKTKYGFFGKGKSSEALNAELEILCGERFEELIALEFEKRMGKLQDSSLQATFCRLLDKKMFRVLSFVFGFPMYGLILIFSNPYVKYVSERLCMMVFVVFGVTFIVFTILYFSPMDPAKNIVGQLGTAEQFAEFDRVHGLDKPYVVQLMNSFKGIVTFNVGKSYMGSEEVIPAIARRFPVTLQLTFLSLAIALIIAIPAGVLSAIKQYSAFDYIFMLLALLGLSIPSFWLGLMMILNFSINNKILPALYDVNNWKTLIMPAVILGTGLAASVARMTRSSMLEVKKEGYIVTARAKGLSAGKVTIKHILGNAMIPIVTVVGLQFGGMLGGAAVTERVFNVNGIGSYIVEKQFIPDTPIVLAGVVYVAIVVSLANLFVDILYAFLDPRIKSKMKAY